MSEPGWHVGNLEKRRDSLGVTHCKMLGPPLKGWVNLTCSPDGVVPNFWKIALVCSAVGRLKASRNTGTKARKAVFLKETFPKF